MHRSCLRRSHLVRDDVVRKVEAEAKKTHDLVDVSQEKSKLGLGDLYAEEYRRSALGVKPDDEVEKQHVRSALYSSAVTARHGSRTAAFVMLVRLRLP
jgi:hypothetical protein